MLDVRHKTRSILRYGIRRLIPTQDDRALGILSVLLLFVFLFASCTKDVELDIPGAEEKMVVQGTIEPGQPPLVILTHTNPYFGTNNFTSVDEIFIHNATITVSNGSYTAQLSEICTNDIPDSLLPLIAEYVGLDSLTLSGVNFCIYSTFDANIYGQVGGTYSLNIDNGGKLASAVTTIPQPVPLDSIWFKLEFDTYGFIWANLSEPLGMGNAYRWFTKRLHQDGSFLAPWGSAFEDKFIDGTSFEFAYNRPDTQFEETNQPEGENYFQIGDTIVVKFCSIDYPHYQFWRTYETQAVNNGNPFAAPTTIRTNITGGLGIWGGYSPSYDTLIVQ